MWFLLGLLIGLSSVDTPVWYRHSDPSIPWWWIIALAVVLGAGFVVMFRKASNDQRQAYDRAERSARHNLAEMNRRSVPMHKHSTGNK